MLRRLAALTALGLATFGCSSSSSPATAPATAASAPTSSTTAASSTTSTSSVDPVAARRAEIEQIIQDVMFRQIHALWEDDFERFMATFANKGFYESTLDALDPDYEYPREPEPPVVDVLQVLFDSGDCLSVQANIDFGDDFGESGLWYQVYERRSDGQWGASYFGTGYGCVNDHPFGTDRL